MLQELIGKEAPTIARALGGPLAGDAVEFLCKFFGLPTDSTKDDLIKQIQEGSLDALEMQKANLEYEKHLDDNKIEMRRLDAAELDSARKMRIDLKDNFPNFLASLVTVGFFAIFYIVWQTAIPDINRSTIDMLIGALISRFGTVFDFYFGNSHKERQNTAIQQAT
jgi:hypothetical protein